MQKLFSIVTSAPPSVFWHSPAVWGEYFQSSYASCKQTACFSAQRGVTADTLAAGALHSFWGHLLQSSKQGHILHVTSTPALLHSSRCAPTRRLCLEHGGHDAQPRSKAMGGGKKSTHTSDQRTACSCTSGIQAVKTFWMKPQKFYLSSQHPTLQPPLAVSWPLH